MIHMNYLSLPLKAKMDAIQADLFASGLGQCCPLEMPVRQDIDDL